jgi:hypothetical protein
MKRYLARLFFTAVLLFIFSGAFAGPHEDCKEFALYGLPSTDGQLLCRKGYLLAHDPDNRDEALLRGGIIAISLHTRSSSPL